MPNEIAIKTKNIVISKMCGNGLVYGSLRIEKHFLFRLARSRIFKFFFLP